MSPNASMDSSVPLLERVSPGLVPELRRYHHRHRDAVRAMIDRGGEGAGLPAGERYAKAFDGLLSALFHAARAAMVRSEGWRQVSLAAVGSYGRGAVSLHSDLDVRLLCEGRAARAGPVAEALLYPLWDSGLTIGHQVVTVDEMASLARRDLPTATSLLDWRHLAGDCGPTDRLLARVHDGLFAPGNVGDFLETMAAQAYDREERFGGSVFLLEPDVKNGAGGIRDLDIAQWVGRARWRAPSFRDLVRLGVLVPRELDAIESAQSFQWTVRNLLHLHAGRRSDRLGFEQQERVAAKLGYGSGGHDVERFMRDYYRHARAAARARDTLLARAAPPPRRRPVERDLGGGLKMTNRRVSFRDPADLERDPTLALRLYAAASRLSRPVYDYAREQVARAASSPAFCDRLRRSEEAARIFVQLCASPKESPLEHGSILRELHDVGLLLAMVPEFAPVVGRVHHDVYHVYTVDAHSIAAVDRLAALCRGDLAGEHPLACRLAAEISRPTVLFFATLLHDVGKDIGGKAHTARGAELAAEILGRLGVGEVEIREVQHLVRKHLRMYHVATRRDVDDPKTLEEFAGEVHGTEGLRELYLLTVADVSTTSPTAFSSWKRRMLDDLFTATARWLEEGGRRRADGAGADAVRRAVAARWPDDEGRPFLEAYLREMPVRYLYANEPDAMRRHAKLALESIRSTAAVRVMAVDEPYVELAVVADDRPGLLARITAVFTAARVKIVAGQIYSWKDPGGRVRALDLFWVRGGREARNVVEAVETIGRELVRVIEGGVDPGTLVPRPGLVRNRTWSDRPAPHVATRVTIDNRCATDHTVIEVLTLDRIGLLFALSSCLLEEGLTVDLAKINTEGTRVADVFYVTDEAGAKVTDRERVEGLRSRILTRVEALGSDGGAGG